jgi:GDP-4-dehydro-6-deoxy-D-mannose reductase
MQGAGILSVGNLEPVRDFSHVEDVVAAYRLLLDRGVAGEAYNVSSGIGRTVRSVVEEMILASRVAARIEVDPARLRPVELPYLVGDSAKLRALGWAPKRTVRDALDDAIAEAREARTAS